MFSAKPELLRRLEDVEALSECLVEVMAKQAEVLKVQAATAQSSQRSAWWLSICTIVVAAGSLAVAVLALTLDTYADLPSITLS